MAQRREQSGRQFEGRYLVKDDTVTTWKVVDTETGSEVCGLTKFAAEQYAQEHNAEGTDYDQAAEHEEAG